MESRRKVSGIVVPCEGEDDGQGDPGGAYVKSDHEDDEDELGGEVERPAFDDDRDGVPRETGRAM